MVLMAFCILHATLWMMSLLDPRPQAKASKPKGKAAPKPGPNGYLVTHPWCSATKILFLDCRSARGLVQRPPLAERRFSAWKRCPTTAHWVSGGTLMVVVHCVWGCRSL